MLADCVDLEFFYELINLPAHQVTWLREDDVPDFDSVAFF